MGRKGRQMRRKDDEGLEDGEELDTEERAVG